MSENDRIKRLQQAMNAYADALRDLSGGEDIYDDVSIVIVRDLHLRYEDYPSWSFWRLLREWEDEEYDSGVGDLDAMGIPSADELL